MQDWVADVRGLSEGRLMMPFGTALISRANYRVLCRAGQQEKPAIAAFLGWLRQEAAALAGLRDGVELVQVEDLAA